MKHSEQITKIYSVTADSFYGICGEVGKFVIISMQSS